MGQFLLNGSRRKSRFGCQFRQGGFLCRNFRLGELRSRPLIPVTEKNEKYEKERKQRGIMREKKLQRDKEKKER